METIRRSTCRPILLVAIVVAGACGSPPPPPPSPSIPPPSPAATVPPGPMTPRPPDVAIISPGADPIIGQLGTFSWGDDGSSSPWLPGTPVTVEEGATLRFALSASAPVRRWIARYAPAGEDFPMRTEPLRSGGGFIELPPPAPGDWTVELFIVFGPAADGQDLGEASYFWRMAVR